MVALKIDSIIGIDWPAVVHSNCWSFVAGVDIHRSRGEITKIRDKQRIGNPRRTQFTMSYIWLPIAPSAGIETPQLIVVINYYIKLSDLIDRIGCDGRETRDRCYTSDRPISRRYRYSNSCSCCSDRIGTKLMKYLLHLLVSNRFPLYYKIPHRLPRFLSLNIGSETLHITRKFLEKQTRGSSSKQYPTVIFIVGDFSK